MLLSWASTSGPTSRLPRGWVVCRWTKGPNRDLFGCFLANNRLDPPGDRRMLRISPEESDFEFTLLCGVGVRRGSHALAAIGSRGAPAHTVCASEKGGSPFSHKLLQDNRWSQEKLPTTSCHSRPVRVSTQMTAMKR